MSLLDRTTELETLDSSRFEPKPLDESDHRAMQELRQLQEIAHMEKLSGAALLDADRALFNRGVRLALESAARTPVEAIE
jgi:hypothetical protein